MHINVAGPKHFEMNSDLFFLTPTDMDPRAPDLEF